MPALAHHTHQPAPPARGNIHCFLPISVDGDRFSYLPRVPFVRGAPADGRCGFIP
jgi:hypothetical protein